MSFEQYILLENDNDPKMGVSPFLAIFGEYIRSEITSADVIDIIEEYISDCQSSPVTLSEDDVTDINTIISTLDSLPDSESKLLYILQFRDFFDIAENNRISLYNTRESIKTRLGFV